MTKWEQIVGQFQASSDGRPVFVVPPPVKLCTKCKQIKPRSDFYARPGHSLDALMTQCKPCHIAAQKERAKERQKARRAAMTPEQRRAEAQRQSARAKARNGKQPVAKFDWPEDA